MRLDRLLAPRSIAVVGATERAGAYGSEALLNLARLRFGGRVYGVNPTRSRVHGVACAPSLSAIGEPVDAVVVAIPADGVADVLEEAGELGCGGAVVFAAGFGEARDGARAHDALVAAAHAHALPVCGPNGNGIVALGSRVALWGDQVSAQESGPVALVSQSGNVAVNALASRRGLRLHTVVSCGNQAVLGAEDYVEAIAGLDGVGSIALYLEQDGDGERWCQAFEACARAGVGVAILKAGASAAGAAAAQAHTGAVAGDARAFRAFVEDCGAVWASDPHELLEMTKALASAGPRGRGGTGLAVMTCSGGDSSVAADLAQELGVALPSLTPETTARVEALLPPSATALNPLDYTSLLWDDPDALARLVAALGDDPAVDRVLVLYDEPAGMDGDAAASWATVLGAIRVGARACAVPVAVASTLPELLADASAVALGRDGLPAIAGLRTALSTMRALAAPAPDAERIAAIARAGASRPADGPVRWLAEHEAKALLRDAGVEVPRGAVVEDAEAAVAAAAGFERPVALKLTGSELRHKSELGALRLSLHDADAVRSAARELLALGAGDALLVEQMAAPGAELLVSVRTDSIVGVLVVGLGGVWTEAFDDAVVLPLPVTPARVARAIESLRGAAMLTGGRGRPVLDIPAAARLACAAAEAALAGGIRLLELNPVIVGAQGACAVDALAAVAPVPIPVHQGAAP